HGSTGGLTPRRSPSRCGSQVGTRVPDRGSLGKQQPARSRAWAPPSRRASGANAKRLHNFAQGHACAPGRGGLRVKARSVQGFGQVGGQSCPSSGTDKTPRRRRDTSPKRKQGKRLRPSLACASGLYGFVRQLLV